MKLYELPPGTTFWIGDAAIKFHHVDGMYSYCTVEEEEDNVLHLWASAPMEKRGDQYHLLLDLGEGFDE